VKARILFPKKYRTTDNDRIAYWIATISPNAFFTPSTLIQSAIYKERIQAITFRTTNTITRTSPEIWRRKKVSMLLLKQTRYTHRTISIYSVSNNYVASCRQAKAQHRKANRSTPITLLVSNHQPESQDSHRPYNCREDHCRKAVFGFSMPTFPSSHPSCNEVDQFSADKEWDYSTDKACGWEDTKTVYLPVIRSCGECPRRGQLNWNVPVLKLERSLSCWRTPDTHHPTNTPIVSPTNTAGGYLNPDICKLEYFLYKLSRVTSHAWVLSEFNSRDKPKGGNITQKKLGTYASNTSV